MEEQIYQDVWCRVFGQVWTADMWNDANLDLAETHAGKEADRAAAAAVRQWDESKRLAVITSKNEGK